MNNTSYNFVDLMKFLMATLVVVGHTTPLRDISSTGDFLVMYVLARVAVPYFFVMAGFFLFRKMQEDNIDFSKIKKYLLRIFEMYSIWCLIYLPWKLYFDLQNNTSYTFVSAFVDFLKGSFLHLWFLYALIIGVLLINFLLKKNFSIYKIISIAALFHILGLLSSSYYGIFEILFPPKSVIFETVSVLSNYFPIPFSIGNGFLFVSIGAAMALKKWRIKNKNFMIIGMLLSWLLVLGEAYYTKYVANWMLVADAYITTVPLVIFTALLSFEIHLPDSFIWTRMRQMSMYIYLIHPFGAWSAVAIGIMTDSDHVRSFFYTLLGSIVISYLLVILKERYNWSWLRKLG